MAFSLDGRRALVTGAASGIGAAIARMLRECGAQVTIADLDMASARTTAQAIAGNAVQMDVRLRSSVETGFAEALELMG
ncbi:MAG: SDR family NAD(P)-dependent oxidoreductase, partial [Rhizobiaceae bacterium]|nr:SDR family NAD(P)-dependent oxidoreductase [Rhizobiaceae bacterium]